MSQLVNYSIIEAGLRALADKAHESAVAQAEGKPIHAERIKEGKISLAQSIKRLLIGRLGQGRGGAQIRKFRDMYIAVPAVKVQQQIQRRHHAAAAALQNLAAAAPLIPSKTGPPGIIHTDIRVLKTYHAITGNIILHLFIGFNEFQQNQWQIPLACVIIYNC